MNKKRRLERVVNFVRKKRDKALKNNPELAGFLAYRWQHTLRVTQHGKRLAKEEGADVETVVVACLLHDIAKLSNKANGLDHGRVGAKIARPFLQELGYAKKDVENICFSIARHVDGKAGFEHPLTLEAQVVSDADKIDRFSNYRILQALEKNIGEEYDDFIRSVESQLARLDREVKIAFVQTKSGKKAFNEQIALQRAYLERLIVERKMTILPEL